MIRTLLLNNDNRIISFINERKTIKLLLKNKVEILSCWLGRKISINSKFILHPAILRMKYHIRLLLTRLKFSKKLLFSRDHYTCTYCGLKCLPEQLTIDHVLPRSLGGVTSFNNCVAACLQCNSSKRDRTPEIADMPLLNFPASPNNYLYLFPRNLRWHEDWNFFL